jgi:hypothetical protein
MSITVQRILSDPRKRQNVVFKECYQKNPSRGESLTKEKIQGGHWYRSAIITTVLYQLDENLFEDDSLPFVLSSVTAS